MASDRVTASVCIACVVLMAGCNSSRSGSASTTIEERIRAETARARELGWVPKPAIALEASVPTLPRDIAVRDLKLAIEAMLEGEDGSERRRDFKPEIESSLRAVALERNSVEVEAKKPSADLLGALQNLKPQLDRLSEILNRPVWDESPQPSHEAYRPTPTIEISLMRALGLRAFLRVSEGDHAAVADIQAVRNIGRLMVSEPDVTNSLIGTLYIALANGQAERAAAVCSKDNGFIRKLADAWSRPIASADYRLLWSLTLSERLDAIARMADKSEIAKIPFGDFKPADPKTVKPARLKILQIGNKSLEDWTGAPNDINVAMQAIREPSKEVMAALSSYHPYYKQLFSSTAEGSLYKALADLKRVLAIDRMSYLALKAVSTGQMRGRYVLPKEAAEEQWLDPYSGKPFLFKATKDGFTIYSVGEDGKDDNGVDKVGNKIDTDIVWSFVRQ